MKNKLVHDFKQDVINGSLIGIGISLTINIVTGSISTNPLCWISMIVFGFLVGILITAGNHLTIELFYRVFPNNQKTTILLLVLIYFVSVVIFYGFSMLSNRFLQVIPPVADILYVSFGVGIASIMITLFFIYAHEKDALIKLEKDNKDLAVVEERNRIARELHDSVSQNLFGISLNLNTLRYIFPKDPDKASQIIGQLQEMVQEVQTEMRLMIFELKPVMLAEKGFFEALESLVNLFRVRYSLDIQSNFHGEEIIASSKQLVLYRVLQETLNNIIKHAHATKVRVTLKVADNHGELEIIDNGKGFSISGIDESRHLGIRGMKERVYQMKGEFILSSQPEKGTTVRVKI